MDFETIEDSIIAELKAQIPYLRSVETYAGQLEDEIEALPLRFPAAYVAYGGSDFAPGEAGSAGRREACAFSVLVGARSLKGQEKARKEAGGAYDAVRDVLAALADKDFGLGIEPLAPMRTSLLFAGRETAVYAVEFRTAFEGGA
jgi:phage gp37-like protein